MQEFLKACDELSDDVTEKAFIRVFRAGWQAVGSPLDGYGFAGSVGVTDRDVDDWVWDEDPARVPGPLHRRVILGRLLRFVRGLS